MSQTSCYTYGSLAGRANMGTPVPDFQGLAQQILAFTQLNWDPKNPQPGDKVVVGVVPGYFPAIPLTGVIPLPAPLGDVSVLLQSAVQSVQVTVQYAVTDGDGNPVTIKSTPISPQPPPFPNAPQLQSILTIPPPFRDELKMGDPLKPFNLVVTITVTVEGVSQNGTITVPLPIPAVPIPGVLLLSADANHQGELFHAVRNG